MWRRAWGTGGKGKQRVVDVEGPVWGDSGRLEGEVGARGTRKGGCPGCCAPWFRSILLLFPLPLPGPPPPSPPPSAFHLLVGHRPELILNNFNTRLGHRLGRMLATLFPYDPQFRGRQAFVFIHMLYEYI